MEIASSVWSCLAHARGEARLDSDYDIAVFLKDLTDRWCEFHRLADLRVEILVETSAFLEARPFRAGSHCDRTPLMHEIRRDGIDLVKAQNRSLIVPC
jgi:predicted nucleotidyltransferase